MKKSLLIGAVAIVVLAGLGGGYGLLHKGRTGPGALATTTAVQKHKQLNLSTLLGDLQAKYPTIKQVYIYTQDRDPNNDLGKAGWYSGGAEFYDTRTNMPPDGTAFGADSGGSIEVYPDNAGAAKRAKYLEQFQGQGALDTGAIQQVNNVVVRVSSQYNGADQTDMINYLVAQLM